MTVLKLFCTQLDDIYDLDVFHNETYLGSLKETSTGTWIAKGSKILSDEYNRVIEFPCPSAAAFQLYISSKVETNESVVEYLERCLEADI